MKENAGLKATLEEEKKQQNAYSEEISRLKVSHVWYLWYKSGTELSYVVIWHVKGNSWLVYHYSNKAMGNFFWFDLKRAKTVIKIADSFQGFC